ncbi:RagB/SusD family nutrient uptake outer membrane protein [Labilibaculum euxinus]|uniref:RagB/SusD family nutrient uptake outer membrane protein n=1 Tax=Labilibaculum euxinus TaxID=2686357 RepID=A0A7M4D9W4_9BACT|nr:RagB/SusD family nutrient uptake outer membrane protein [Labilibaculum euxinus]MUP39443.1 RagB/SusD family nutrient uptake outer membrane protein [Labilibaculum euxinus]MVB08648.1 RagB/SusD family nutrient uptake outer membrane protein [Labilibaculum euxinus]
MLKKYMSKALIFASFVGIVSCSDDFTSLTPLGSATESNYFQTQADAEAAVNSMYYYMGDEDMFSRGFMWYINASDDMITGRIKAEADNIKNFNLTGDEGYASWMYPQSYKIIRRANDVLANVPDMDFDESVKKRCLGEAYFMRAFHYFWVASTYGNDVSGGVPIVTVENMKDTKFQRPASVTENYAQIVEDLTKAADLLPLYTSYSSENKGRAHKDACYAYIAKTYLYWAQYDDSKWEKVIEFCDKVSNSGSGRKLIDTDTPESDFRSVFTYQNEFGSEYIWSVTSGIDRGSKLVGVMLENKGWGVYNGWGYYTPTEELFEAFEDGDYRRSATILNFGDEFQFWGESRRYYSTNSLSGFQFNKYMDIYSYADPIGNGLINANGDALYTIQDVPILRYAEVVLMKAEAKLKLSKNADTEINLIRNRAGLSSKVNCTMADLKQERRVEFAGEFANRHRDLVRWGDAESIYSKPLHGRIHSDKTNPDSPYTIEEVWPARTYKPDVHNVWIIPSEVISSSGIDQNIGW